MKKQVVGSIAVLTALILIVGCAPLPAPPPPLSARPQAKMLDEGRETFQDLVKNSDKYIVYVFTFRYIPCALLFDPKDDDKVVQVSEKWKKIANRMELESVIERSEILKVYSIPALYSITGSDGKVWAYLGSYVTEVNVTYINDHTIKVWDLTLPVQRP